MELWHNPRCSKSRAAKAILDESGVAYVERRYVDEPPTVEELDDVLAKLGMEPWDITRFEEARAKELGLKDAPRVRASWLKTLAANPILVQRPIVVTNDGRAVIGRPPEKVLDLLRRDP